MKLKIECLELLPADPSLAEQVAEYYQRNREFLRGFEPVRDPAFYTPQFQKGLLEQEAKDREEGRSCRFYIRSVAEPDKIIGAIGLNNIVRGAFQSAFLGYKLDADYCGRGYMTQAVSLVVSYGFETLKLHRIEGNVMPRNLASIRVLEKNGFCKEGISRYYLNINGIWEDHVHMVKLNFEMHRT